MKKFLLILTALAAFTACKQEEKATMVSFNAAALATPYVHNGDTSIFHIKDYTLEEGAVLSGLPAGVYSYFTGDGVYKIFGRPENTLGTMRISSRKNTFEVPFVKGQKRGVQFRVAAFEGQDVKVKGEFNAWNAEASFLQWDGDAWVWNLVLAPGDYAYKLVVDGQEVMDPTNVLSQANGFGGFNNILSVASESEAEPRGVRFVGGGKLKLMFTPMPENQEVLAMLNNTPLTYTRSPLATIVELPEEVESMELAWVRLYSARGGKLAPDALIPLKYGKVVEDPKELDRSNWHTSIMYFAMIDRFHNGDASNDQPVDDPAVHPRANYQGGDIEGLRAKVNDGYFDSLGVNCLWISPLTQNPEDAWGLWNQGGPVSTFSGYHGYWPVSNIKPDHRFASEEDVHAFLNDAHAKGNNVLLDYVANHVHELHPVYQKNPQWATNKYTEDGRLNTQLWDEERLTTWFDTFMPTLELRNDTVADLMSDSALVWITEYPFDGFRHDATKHIPMNFTRLLTEKIRKVSDKHVYQIGETYGSDELIASYVGSGKVDAQFNFNLYDAAFEAFTQKGVSFDRLKKSLESSLTYYGYHHLMGNISGNQDKPRFASMASGHLSPGEDSKLAGWTREIPEANERGFRKMACMHAFNIAVPGIPIIYYGDEIAMHGGNDPDNRKMMRFEDHNNREKALWEQTAALIHLRRNSMALNYGGTDIYQPEANVLVIERQFANEYVRFFFNNNSEDITLEKWGVTVPADNFTYQTEILERE
jgi:glycosidase